MILLSDATLKLKKVAGRLKIDSVAHGLGRGVWVFYNAMICIFMRVSCIPSLVVIAIFTRALECNQKG